MRPSTLEKTCQCTDRLSKTTPSQLLFSWTTVVGAFWVPGQNYKVPSEVRECFTEHEGNYTAQAACSPPDNHFDSVLALDLDSGKVRQWLHMVQRENYLLNQGFCPRGVGGGGHWLLPVED
jgi:hypothetical protein